MYTLALTWRFVNYRPCFLESLVISYRTTEYIHTNHHFIITLQCVSKCQSRFLRWFCRWHVRLWTIYRLEFCWGERHWQYVSPYQKSSVKVVCPQTFHLKAWLTFGNTVYILIFLILLTIFIKAIFGHFYFKYRTF